MAQHPPAQSIFAYLTVEDADAAIAWYVEVFDGVDEGPTLRGPDGVIMHAEVRVGASVFFLADARADPSGASPAGLGGTPVRMALDVPDVDATSAKAVERGAKILIPIDDQFYGHRAGRIQDPFGHIWIISTPIEEVSADDMQRRLDKLMSGGEG